MSRNCPSCGITLSKADVHFCSSCGAHLDEVAHPQEKKYFSGGNVDAGVVKPSFSVRSMVIVCVVFIMLGGLAYLITHLISLASVENFSIDKIFVQNTPKTKTPVVTNNVVKPVETTEPVVTKNNIELAPENILPFDTEVVMLFERPVDFLEGLAFFGIENTLDMDFLQNSNRSPYIILLSSVGSASGPLNTLVFFPSTEVSGERYAKYFSKDLSKTEVNNLKMVSNDPLTTEEITEIAKGLKKGLNLNSLYITIKNKIPTDARAKILVFTDNGVGYVNRLKVDKMPESLKALFMNYLSSGSYYGYLEK